MLEKLQFVVEGWTLPLRDFLFPPLCASCDNLLDSRTSLICRPCWSLMRLLAVDDALYNETRLRLLAMGNICELISCYVFDDNGPLQSAIHRLKYQNVPAIGVEFGVRLGEQIALHSPADSRTLIVPVPLHRAKLRERGYNQSHYICKGITRVVPSTLLPHLLIRHRYTRSQTTLHRDERRQNVHDAFRVNPRSRDAISGNRIIIVDDVITTGATIDECASLLLSCGAKKVIASSVALAP